MKCIICKKADLETSRFDYSPEEFDLKSPSTIIEGNSGVCDGVILETMGNFGSRLLDERIPYVFCICDPCLWEAREYLFCKESPNHSYGKLSESWEASVKEKFGSVEAMMDKSSNGTL